LPRIHASAKSWVTWSVVISASSINSFKDILAEFLVSGSKALNGSSRRRI